MVTESVVRVVINFAAPDLDADERDSEDSRGSTTTRG